MKKKVVFLTGTRADFGKMKPLMRAVKESPLFESTLFVTGMHTLLRYGYTIEEIHASGFSETHLFMNQYTGNRWNLYWPIPSAVLPGFARV